MSIRSEKAKYRDALKALPYTLVLLLPLSVVLGYFLGGVFLLMTPFFVFVMIPVVDIVVGTDTSNPGTDQEKLLEENRAYRYITWICAPVQVAVVIWGAYAAAHSSFNLFEFIAFSLALGISSGVMGINVSHELQHRVNYKLEPLLARIMLWTTGYMHWSLEHVVGHHRNVATPQDPATARLGESLYHFLPRTVFGSFQSAREFERLRLKRLKKTEWTWDNRVVRYLTAQILLIMGITVLFGFRGLVFFLLQAIVAIGLLETVNYIEHYGLMRRIDESGKYESVKPYHSWNSSHLTTNLFLFNLQRHSDHHFRPGRRYQLLRHFHESPQLPIGYAGMVMLALVPPLWFWIMDPRVKLYWVATSGFSLK